MIEKIDSTRDPVHENGNKTSRGSHPRSQGGARNASHLTRSVYILAIEETGMISRESATLRRHYRASDHGRCYHIAG